MNPTNYRRPWNFAPTTIQGKPRLTGLRGFWTDILPGAASPGSVAPSAVAAIQGESVPPPSDTIVPLSPDMTYGQGIDYARAGYQALQIYVDASAFLFDTSLAAALQAAQTAYASAADSVAQDSGGLTTQTIGTLDLAALVDADSKASSALAAFRSSPAVATSSAPTVAKAASVLPPANLPVNAATLHAAQQGFWASLGTFGQLGVGVGLALLAIHYLGK